MPCKLRASPISNLIRENKPFLFINLRGIPGYKLWAALVGSSPSF
jgi:hypothetical protein